MPSSRKRPYGPASRPPMFENLEERLLLTTLAAGDFFVYHNSQGEQVRITLNNSGSVELFAKTETGEVVDLPGLLNGYEPVNWPAGDWPGNNHYVVTYNDDGDPIWTEHEEPQDQDNTDTLRDERLRQRGARVEIYAIYFNEADENTTLSISTLSTTQPNGENWSTAIAPWASDNLPRLMEIDGGWLMPPEGSGSVVVGSEGGLPIGEETGIPGGEGPDAPSYDAVDYQASEIIGHNGVFPGGRLYAGIHISDGIGTLQMGENGEALGTDVRGVSVNEDGTAFVVDIDAFLGGILSDGSETGIGSDVSSLTSDGADGFYAVNNGGVGDTNIISDGSDDGIGGTVRALTVDDSGTIYTVHNLGDGQTIELPNGEEAEVAGHALFTVDAETGEETFIGRLLDANTETWQYTNVTMLDAHPTTGELWAIGSIDDLETDDDPGGWFLITIDTDTGRATLHAQVPTILPNLTFKALAWNDDGTELWLLADTGPGTPYHAYILDPTDGALDEQFIMSAGDANGVNSIEFIEDQMYGVSNTTLYYIDQVAGAAVPVAQVQPVLSGMRSLGYRQGTFWTANGFTNEDDNTIYRLANWTIASRLVTVDGFDGSSSQVGPLIGGTIAYRNVTALDADSGGNLFATGTAHDMSDPTASIRNVIFNIDRTSGDVTELASTGTNVLSSIAFDSAGTLYGVRDRAGVDQLVIVDPSTGALNLRGELVEGVTGLEFLRVGFSDALFAVTGSELHAVDAATADTTLLGDTGRSDLSSLAVAETRPGVLWSTSTEDDAYRLVQIDMSSTLVSRDQSEFIDRVALLFDDDIPSYAYVGVTGLEFDGDGNLWGIGEVVNIDPHSPVVPPAPDGPQLIRIDTITGEVTRVADIESDQELTTIAFGDAGTLYAMDSAGSTLVTVNTATGDVTDVISLTVSGFQGIDFVDGVLFGVSGNSYYIIDPTTGLASEVAELDIPGLEMTSLSGDPTNEDILWTTAEFGGEYHLIRLVTDTQEAGLDIGAIQIGGTVAGRLSNPNGFLDRTLIGFLWGDIIAGENLGDVVLWQGGGARPGELGPITPASSVISAGGTIRGVYSLNGATLYSGVLADNGFDAPRPSPVIKEMELATVEDDEEDGYSTGWIGGEFVDIANDSITTAQFINHSTGRFIVEGYIPSTLSLIDDPIDTYAVSLMAGETFTLEAEGSYVPRIWLRDATGNIVDSYGWETIEDQGLGSRGSTPEPISFTAPAAGVYYVEVLRYFPLRSLSYRLRGRSDSQAAIGGISVDGDLTVEHTSTTADGITGDIVVGNAGDLGAIVVTGALAGASVATSPGGDIVAVNAGDIPEAPPGTIGIDYSEFTAGGEIGSIWSWGDISADITSGAWGGNEDADIQNIYAAGNINAYASLGSIVSADDIGVIQIGGLLEGILIQANYDRLGSAGHVDLIDVAGNWGGTGTIGVPQLRHGVGGDFGYVRVGGTIYKHYGTWISAAEPTVVSDGSSRMLQDDGGGRLTISPKNVAIQDQDGNVLEDENGDPVTRPASFAYTVIPVEDLIGGIGGVIANLEVYGGAKLDVEGEVHIGNLEVSEPQSNTLGDVVLDDDQDTDEEKVYGATQKVNISGDGRANIYYLYVDTPLKKFENETTGALVSGLIVSETADGGTGGGGTGGVEITEPDYTIDKMFLAGSLGAVRNGHTGAWIPGQHWVDDPELPAQPTATGGADEEGEAVAGVPLFGWFAGRVNGLAIEGNINELKVNGSIGDLLVAGQIGELIADADGVTAWDGWDGINGVIWANGTPGEGDGDGGTPDSEEAALELASRQATTIDKIHVGDGLADDGAGGSPRAGIFVEGTLGGVYIEGPRYEYNGNIYGELNGSIIATTDLFLPEIAVTVDDGNGEGTTEVVQREQLLPAIGEVIGKDGAVLTANVVGGSTNLYQAFYEDAVWSGGIGKVEMSGPGAAITGSEIVGLYIDEVITSSDSNGIRFSYITGSDPSGISPDNGASAFREHAIGRILAGGPGMHRTWITGVDGSILSVEGNSPVADFTQNTVVAASDLNTFTARDMIDNEVRMPGTVGELAASRDMDANYVGVGAIEKFEVGRDIIENEIRVAGLLEEFTVGGAFTDTVLALHGPSVADLRSLDVQRGITGRITSAGHIGEIISRTGTISADISTLDNGWNSDVDSIQAARGYNGDLNVAGSLHEFISGTSLGDNPETTTNGRTQQFDVWDDLGDLVVNGDLYAGLNVGGNAESIEILGDYYGEIYINGHLDSFDLTGALGGLLTIDGVGQQRGSLSVLGDIRNMEFPTTTDIYADLTVGGSLEDLKLKGASIHGDIRSIYGSIGQIKMKGGTISGDLTARQFDKIQVKGGGPVSISGNVTATGGSIGQVQTDGDVTGDLTASDRIEKLKIAGDIDGTVRAANGLGKAQIKDGDLNGALISGAELEKLKIKGNDMTGFISAASYIENVKIDGNISGRIRAAQNIDKLKLGGNVNGGLLAAGTNIDNLKVKGNISFNSQFVAGYDIGEDGLFGTADDVALSGTLSGLKVKGGVNDSILAAGVGPGADGDFRTTGDNTLGDGTSFVRDIDAKSGFSGNNWAMAETSVAPELATSIAATGGTVFEDNAVALPGGLGLPTGPLTITLEGFGTATYETNWAPGVDRVLLNGTNTESEMTISWTGAGAYGNSIRIDGADDAGLDTLEVVGNVSLDDVTIDGRVEELIARSVVDGATWSLPGGVGEAYIASGITNVTVAAGTVGEWVVNGAYLNTAAASFTAYAIGTLQVGGDMGANLVAMTGGIGELTINGDFDGTLDSHGKVGEMSVAWDVTNVINVHKGNLESLSVGRNFSGRVNVAGGVAKDIFVGGNVADGDTSIRAYAGIDTVDVLGNFDGVLSTHGTLKNLKVGQNFGGRGWAGGNINNAELGGMLNALLAASGNLDDVEIAGDMTDSWLFAGFDPGDAGYDPAAGGEAANNRVDSETLDAWRTADNADRTGGGSIKSVEIGRDMIRSTISGAVGPGDDGYVGTTDDVIGGVGYVREVEVGRGIIGSGDPDASYGVFAASAMPSEVTHHDGQPFRQNGNATVDTLATIAGALRVTRVYVGPHTIRVTFNHPINSATVTDDTVRVESSVDSDFSTAGDNTNLNDEYDHNIVVNNADYSITYTLVGQFWSNLDEGEYRRIVITDDVTDHRGYPLDGELTRGLPSGDGIAGGDFVYNMFVGDTADTFSDALADLPLNVPVDGGTQVISGDFDNLYDVDIFSFAADALEFVAVEFFGDPIAEIGLFWQDDQGTADSFDDTYEIVAGWDDKQTSDSSLFQAFELSETGNYFVAVAPAPFAAGALAGDRSYTVTVTRSSSDTQLLDDLGGSLPVGEQIAYFSNEVGENNNNLGANDPKQLVYLDFDGGIATEFEEQYHVSEVVVPAFDASVISSDLAGYTDTLIDGAPGVTGIVDNMVSIFANTPGSHPLGTLNVNVVDLSNPADWAAYQAADDGLWFTTVDPAVAQGLNPQTEFTTVFLGQPDPVDLRISPDGLFGIASDIDLANQDKANNALVFAQNFGVLELLVNWEDTTEMLNEYSRAVANVTAHELGHTLGLNHQPTWGYATLFGEDDPDNNPATENDANDGYALMGYQTLGAYISDLWELGTADLSASEFQAGQIDTADLLLKWLS